MKIINQVVVFHGWLADKDFIWWPFSFLRPDPKSPMTFQLTCLMTLCFAGLTYLMYVFYAVANNAFEARGMIQYFFIFFIGFFVWFNAITRPLWNARVRKLK